VSGTPGYSCLTLLTDYGVGGGFVGVLHAVAHGIAPGLPVIDLDHSVPPQDVRRGAHRLERLIAHVPPGVHVAVVDPGVGTARRPLAIETHERVFVGPDNGLLARAAERCGPLVGVTVLEAEQWWHLPRSRTFDGRDVFVPAAAHLASGVPLAQLGPRVDPATLLRLPDPVARTIAGGGVELEVVDVDGFGNVQLAGGPEALAGLDPGQALAVQTATGPHDAVYGGTFADVPEGELVCYIDSDGLPALAVRGGSASATTGLAAGDLVSLRPLP
jgi:S-adenosylmethionine hydrolase